MHNPVGIFADEPELCRECGHDQLESLGTDIDNQETMWWRYLSVDSFTLLAMGLAVFNILSMVLGGFIGNQAMLYSAGISLPILVATAFLASNRTARGWYLGLFVAFLIAAYGAFVAGIGYTVLSDMNVVSTAGDSMRANFFTETGEPLYIIYGVAYAVGGLIGMLFLAGSREEIPEFVEE